MGDMVESLIKRYHHCKDSGSVLPGHGGIYDRFDSSLLSIVLYHYCILSKDSGNSRNQCSIAMTRGY
jgi:phosphatidate cytidylyltransferase